MASVAINIEGSDNQRAVFFDTLRELARRKIAFAIGGSIAMAAYLRESSPVKDLDIYVTRSTSAEAIAALTSLGLKDYFEQVPYQRHWIYRATRGDAIVDVIWAMANSRADVDDDWIRRGEAVLIGGEQARLIPIEELIWSKLYVLQSDRCDWPDVMNLILASPQQIDWVRLEQRLGPDRPLLDAVRAIAQWISESPSERAGLLDRRPWLSEIKRKP